MKSIETKNQFIRMRAEGKSYSVIAKLLNISKSTCTSWERELKDQIAELKQEQLNELYNSYYMTKEARIKKLGATLESINTALDGADLTAVSPEKLLDFKLKYTEALKGEYLGSGTPYQFSDRVTPQEILTALGDLLSRIRAGEVTAEQAGRESLVLSNLLKAYDTVEIKVKLDALEAAIGGRA
jgi:transposase-like protein